MTTEIGLYKAITERHKERHLQAIKDLEKCFIIGFSGFLCGLGILLGVCFLLDKLNF